MFDNLFSYKYSNLQSKLTALIGIFNILHFTPVIGYSDFYNLGTKALVAGSILIYLYEFGIIKRTILSNKDLILTGLMAAFVFIFIVRFNPVKFIQHISMIWPTFVVITASVILRIKIFQYFRLFFVITLIPSILLYPFIASGIPPVNRVIPIHEIKAAYNWYYNNYYFSYQLIDFYSQEGPGLFRMSGLFDEAGVVGTFSAFFLIIGQFKRNTINIILFISGLLSLSLAFFIMSFLYSILKLKPLTTIKIIIITVIFVLIGQTNTFIKKRLLDRIYFENSRFVGDNRSTKMFDSMFDSFVSSPKIWMGSEKSAYDYGEATASWKNIVFEYGILGILLLISFFSVYTLFNVDITHRVYWPFLIIFVLSIYQRPHVFDIANILLFTSGFAYLSTYRRSDV